MSDDTSYYEELLFDRKAVTNAERIVYKIATRLSGSGFDLDDLDRETLRELAEDWVKIVVDELPGPQIVIAGEIKGGVKM